MRTSLVPTRNSVHRAVVPVLNIFPRLRDVVARSIQQQYQRSLRNLRKERTTGDRIAQRRQSVLGVPGGGGGVVFLAALGAIETPASPSLGMLITTPGEGSGGGGVTVALAAPETG